MAQSIKNISFMNGFAVIGRMILNFFHEVGKLSLLFGKTLHWSTVRPFDVKNLIDQIVKTGIDSLPVALITALATGAILALQTGLTLEYYFQGMSRYVPMIVVLATIRELGPVLTALILAGRVGSSMAAEIGTMKVTEQIEALETLSTNPIQYLVVPRFLGMIIMLPLITLIADYVAIFGGGIVCKTVLDLSWPTFFISTIQSFTMGDVYSGMIKSVFFGGFISIVGCYKGLNVFGGAEGVGRATTDSVVIASIMILVGDYLLTTVLNYTIHI